MCEMEVRKFLTHYKYHSPKGEKIIGLRGSGSKSAAYRLVDFINMEDYTFETMFIETCDGSPTVTYGELKLCKTKQVEDAVIVKSSDSNKEFGKSFTKFIIPLNAQFNVKKLVNYIEISYPHNKTKIIVNDLIEKIRYDVQCVDKCCIEDIIYDEDLWNTKVTDDIRGYEIANVNGIYFLHWALIPTLRGVKRVKVISFVISLEAAKRVGDISRRNQSVPHTSGGVFVIRGGRYINIGNNMTNLLGIKTNFGGAGRLRIVIDANDDDVANALGVKTNKGEPINSIVDDFNVMNPNRHNTDEGKRRSLDILYNTPKEELTFFDYIHTAYLEIKDRYDNCFKNKTSPKVVLSYDKKKNTNIGSAEEVSDAVLAKKNNVNKNSVVITVSDKKTEYNNENKYPSREEKFSMICGAVFNSLANINVDVSEELRSKIINDIMAETNLINFIK